MWCGCVRGQTVCGVVVEGSNSVWCGCVRGQTVCGVIVEGSNSVWCGCVRGQCVAYVHVLIASVLTLLLCTNATNTLHIKLFM